MSAEALQSFHALALGFAVAGLLASGYQALTAQPASFRLLNETRPLALAAVPFLVFAAPFIIMRNTIRGRQLEDRNIGFVALATVIAGMWALFSGVAAIEALRYAGFGG